MACSEKHLYVITPTGDRYDALSLCVKYMNRQTYRPYKWVIVDDGKEETSTRLARLIDVPYEIVRRPPYDGNSVAINIRAALELVPDDALVCVMEDDDWYPAEYLDEMYRLLLHNPYVASRYCHIYSVPTRQQFLMKNTTRFAMHGNGFSGEALAEFRKLVNGTDAYWIDGLFNEIWEKKGKTVFNDSHRPVHIAGFGKGRGGTTMYHRPKNEGWWKDDGDCVTLKEWVGEDVFNYEQDDRVVYVFSPYVLHDLSVVDVRKTDTAVFMLGSYYRPYTPDDTLVFYNGAFDRNSVDQSVRAIRIDGECDDCIPVESIEKTSREYPVSYNSIDGERRAPSDIYRVVRYVHELYPIRKIVLVDFDIVSALHSADAARSNIEYEFAFFDRFEHKTTMRLASAEIARQFIGSSGQVAYRNYVRTTLSINGCLDVCGGDMVTWLADALYSLAGSAQRVAVFGVKSSHVAHAVRTIVPAAEVYDIGDESAAGPDVRSRAMLPYGLSLVIVCAEYVGDGLSHILPIFLDHTVVGGRLIISGIINAYVTAVPQYIPFDSRIVRQDDSRSIVVCTKPGTVSLSMAN